MMRRRATSSSGVHAANDLPFSAATSEATDPTTFASLALLPWLRLGQLELGARLLLGPDAERGGVLLVVRLVEEERAEDPVVDRDLVVTGDERRAPCPVEVDEVGRVE